MVSVSQNPESKSSGMGERMSAILTQEQTRNCVRSKAYCKAIVFCFLRSKEKKGFRILWCGGCLRVGGVV